jgi:hypothetical protein
MMALHNLLCLAVTNGLVPISANMFFVAQYCTSTKVVPHVHVLAASVRHVVLAECDTTLIVLVNGDGGPGVLVKRMEHLLKKHRLLTSHSQRHILCLRCRQRHRLLPLTLPTHRCTVEHEHIPHYPVRDYHSRS